MIHFDNVSKRFAGGNYGVSDISLQIESGAMAFITGHSGAGKSTLLRSVGVNTVLALAGAPVCAERLRLSPLVIGASLQAVSYTHLTLPTIYSV